MNFTSLLPLIDAQLSLEALRLIIDGLHGQQIQTATTLQEFTAAQRGDKDFVLNHSKVVKSVPLLEEVFNIRENIIVDLQRIYEIKSRARSGEAPVSQESKGGS